MSELDPGRQASSVLNVASNSGESIRCRGGNVLNDANGLLDARPSD